VESNCRGLRPDVSPFNAGPSHAVPVRKLFFALLSPVALRQPQCIDRPISTWIRAGSRTEG
jgi:hypothetical protein